ncbi:MAG: matrixin family metalloprotease, partial [Verrucomicrobiaceae bacterium]
MEHRARWHNLAANSGLRFVYEPADDGVAIDGNSGSSDWGVVGVRGDIRISGHLIDGNSNTLAYAYYPDNGDVVVDTGDSYIVDTSSNSLKLRNIMEHEIGHSLGLAHVCPVNQTKLMEPFINLGFRGSQFDDIYSQQRNYGDRLEVHDSVRSNDTFTDATPIDLTPGTQANWQWLSIDDNTDIDFYSFAAALTQQVTVRIIPSDPILPGDPVNDSYLEGAQNVDGTCTAGVAFDPTTQQDLILDLIGPNGTTVVAAAPTQVAGVTELIAAFKFTTAGTHYIRVRGGTNDRAQLYRMEVLLEGVPPSPALTVTAKRLLAESNSGANGVPDPGETVQMGVTLTNTGTLTANNLTVGISSSADVTVFSAAVGFGTLAPGESAERVFTFAVAGAVGQTVNVPLSASATGYSATVPFPVSLGADLGPAPMDEHFDASASLPTGWSQSVVSSGSPWVVSTNRFSTGPNSMYSPSVASAGEARLNAPAMTVGPGGGVLEFTHRYLLESTRDGGVLEASRNGGAFFDLLNSAATVLSGDYNGVIASSAGSAINGREAWTGSAASFVSTRVRLPAAWTGESIIFRWRLVNNPTLVVTGWNIDDVRYFPLAVADPFRPYVSMTSSGSSLSESTSGGQLQLYLSTPMPLARDLPVPIEVSGMASPADLSGSLTITIPLGQTNVTGAVGALLDSLEEGTETLVLSIPTASANVAAAEPYVVALEIEDVPVLTATVELSNLENNYDGTAKPATVTVNPSGLAVTVTYNG